jgi:mRNA interferase HigB
MHVISRKALQLFWEQHPDSKAALARWFQIVRRTTFKDSASLRRTFPTADLVDRFTVFNIAGNKYRLVASIHFNRGKIYIRHVLTHREYDKGAWKQ